MNKVLVAVEAQIHAVPTKALVKEYLTKEWLLAIKSTIRPSAHAAYKQA